MERKYVKINNKSGQDIVLDGHLVKAYSSLELQEHSLTEQVQRRLKSLVNLNKLNFDIITETINNEKPVEFNSQPLTSIEDEELNNIIQVPVEEVVKDLMKDTCDNLV